MKARKRLFPKFYNGACFEKKGSRFVDEGINYWLHNALSLSIKISGFSGGGDGE
jgi:hypothetical protein